MNNHDFQLGDSGSYLGESHGAFVTEVDLGDQDFDTAQDGISLNGNAVFGRYQATRGNTIITALSNKYNEDDALDALRPLNEFWSKSAQFKPGEYTSLAFRVGKREYRIFGRPTKSALSMDANLVRGVGQFVGEFKRADSLFYSSVMESVSLQLVPGSQRGLKAPLKAPLVGKSHPGLRSGQILNENATAPSPCVIRFSGPSKNPTITIGGKKVKLNVTLAYDRWIEVDTRNGFVRWDNGTYANHLLDVSTRLSQVQVPAGKTEIKYSADDSTNLSKAVVSFYPARYSL